MASPVRISSHARARDRTGTSSLEMPDRRVVTRRGTPDDVVKALFYLLESNFVTGQVVLVDGGRTLL